MRGLSGPPAFFFKCTGVGVLSQGRKRHASPAPCRAAVQVRRKGVPGKAIGETYGQGLSRIFPWFSIGVHCPGPSPSAEAALEGF